jgi:hypothetical protein
MSFQMLCDFKILIEFEMIIITFDPIVILKSHDI